MWLLVLGLPSSIGPRFLSSLATGYRGFCADSRWWKSGAYRVLLGSFSIEEYWLHICVEYLQLGGFSNLSGAPNVLENQKSSLCFAYSCPHISASVPSCVSACQTLWSSSFQKVSLSMLSNLFSYSVSLSEEFKDCSVMMRSVVMWPVHDLSCLKPAWWSQSLESTSVFILSIRILLRTLPGTDSSMIPL